MLPNDGAGLQVIVRGSPSKCPQTSRDVIALSTEPVTQDAVRRDTTLLQFCIGARSGTIRRLAHLHGAEAGRIRRCRKV